jgi:hypothetical protein
MADEVIKYAANRFHVTLGGTVAATDLLNFTAGSAWVQADATGKKAEAVALQAGVSGDIIEVATEVTLTDADAPYTVGDYFIGETAGAAQAAVSATGGDLKQQVGYAPTTSTLFLSVGFPKNTTAGTIATV